MIKRILICIGLLLIMVGQCFSQQAGILNAKLQISGLLNDELVVWENDDVNISIDKHSGELNAVYQIAKLEQTKSTDEFVPSEQKTTEAIHINGIVPAALLNESLTENTDFEISMSISYKDEEVQSYFQFEIIVLPGSGFSLVGHGNFDHTDFEIPALENFDDELTLFWNIIGR